MRFRRPVEKARSPLRAPLTLVALIAAACSLGTAAAGALRKPARAARLCANSDTPVGRASRQQVKEAVVCLINRQRAAHGLPPLRASGRLDRSAQGWTNAMVAGGSFSHGSDVGARVAAAGFAAKAVGENIATGYRTAGAVVAAWMASTGHCRNILSPTYTNVGTGLVYRVVGFRENGATWTQDFAQSARRPAPSHRLGPASRCPY